MADLVKQLCGVSRAHRQILEIEDGRCIRKGGRSLSTTC